MGATRALDMAPAPGQYGWVTAPAKARMPISEFETIDSKIVEGVRRDVRQGKLTLRVDMMKIGLLIAVLLTSAAILLNVFSVSLGTPLNEPAQVGSAIPSTASPPYRSSVVGTDFDFITENDPSAFERLEYVGFKEFEMPDKRKTGAPLIQNAYVFNAYFTDGTKIGIALDKDFGSREAAEQDAMRYTPRLGKLPSLYRLKLRHIVVHKGGADTTAFAEEKGHFFVIYSDNATKRIGTHDLEETFFHEATHASIQASYLRGMAWKNAKAADNAYITDYAKKNDREDFAESALFAYTIIYHPERFPAADRAKIEKQIPNRIAFFRDVYTGQPTPPTSPAPPSASSDPP